MVVVDRANSASSAGSAGSAGSADSADSAVILLNLAIAMSLSHS